jgi:trimeric autotransporter adhesin
LRPRIANTNLNEVTAIGYQALRLSTGGANTALGFQSLSSNTTGSNNTGIGYNTQTGNFSGSLILGLNAAATGNNQCVFGSSGTNAGAVAAEVNTSANVWNVRINGVAHKILLA